MSKTRRKVFTFDEIDLKWINPLLVEWEKENKGKNGGVLVTKLLRKYRESHARNKLEYITYKMGSRFIRFNLLINSVFSSLQVTVGNGLRKIKVKLNHIADRIAEDMEKGFSI